MLIATNINELGDVVQRSNEGHRPIHHYFGTKKGIIEQFNNFEAKTEDGKTARIWYMVTRENGDKTVDCVIVDRIGNIIGE